METYAKGRVFKRDRVWWLDYSFNNKRIRESAETTNKTVAERLLHKKLETIDNGTFTHMKKARQIGFADYFERYIETYSNGRPSWKKNILVFFCPLKEFFENKPLSQIQPDLIADYKAKRIKDRIKRNKTNERLVQASTVNRELTALNTFLSKAVTEGYLATNPCSLIENLKFSENGRERQRFLDEMEIQKLLEVSEYPLKQIITIGVYTGMRRGEIENLKWSDITIKDDGGSIKLNNTKNGESRTVIMSSLVREAIVSVRRNPNTNLLFPGKDLNKPWDFRKPFEAAVKKAELNQPGREKLVFHHLRHTFCSQLGLLNYDTKTIMELSGHKDYKMALRYTKLNTAHKTEALERLERKIGVQKAAKTHDEEISVAQKMAQSVVLGVSKSS
jgi:integrase